MPKKAKTEAMAFDLFAIRAPRRYVWREIDREDQDPLRVKLLRLTMAESGELVFEPTTPMKVVHEAVAPYVVEWDFKAENLETGDMVDVPPPAEIGGEVFEVMEDPIGTAVLYWLKRPDLMEKATEKKASTSSESGDEPPKEGTSD